MPEDVAESAVSEPPETPAPESIETPEGEQEASPPALSELINADNLDEVLALPSVAERLAEQERVAGQRAKNQIQAEQRKSLDQNTVVTAAAGILQEAGIESQNLTRSMVDRLSNLFGSVRTGAAEQLAEQIPQAFFNGYELPQETVADYLDKVNAKDVDGSIKTLVDGAVALKTAEIESATEQRIETEVAERVKQELEAARENGGLNLPATSRGTNTSNTAIALTSGEIERMPATVWTALPADVKTQLHTNVAKADADRGAETVDVSRLERVAGLAQG